MNLPNFLFLVAILFSQIDLSAQCLKGDCKNGQGIYKFKSGASFEGFFERGQYVQGTYFFSNGDIYVGTYENLKRHGFGKYYYSDGRYFEGQYEDGEKVNGKMLYNDSTWYSGQYKSGKRHGEGALIFSNGNSLRGIWKNGQYLGTNTNNAVTTYVLVVGIEKYSAISPLRYTVDDAKAFEESINTGKFGNIPENHIISLYNKSATKQQILSSLKFLTQKADSNDRVIFYFSGHGAEGALCPQDTDLKSPNSALLLYSEIKKSFALSKAATKLLIVDACHAGGLLPVPGNVKRRNIKNNVNWNIDVAIFMSCKPDEYSREDPSIGHGVFTYFLLQGLGPAADVNNDNMITLAEWYYYTRNNTYSHVQRKNNGKQTPILVGKYNKNSPITFINQN